MKTKLKIMIALIGLFTNTIIAQPKGPRAQRNEEKRENIEALKVAFLTDKLSLTPEEAQQFWPVYNQYTEKLQELRKKRRQGDKDIKLNYDALSDKEIEQAIDADLANRQKELDLQKEYNAKFKAVLPMKKVAKLYNAEEQFKMVLLNKLKDKRQPPPPPQN
ncbi:MAG: hypothetical protein ACXVPY_01010 [Bacteroidia bacterium]